MQLHKPLSSFKISYWLINLFLFLILNFGCSSVKNPYAQLIKNDFYAYILPESILEEKHWFVNLLVNDNFDAHCKGGPSAPWNPIEIVYQDQQGNHQFSIRISESDAVWNRQNPIDNIELDFHWVQSGSGMIYQGEKSSPIKFVDIFGNEVVVSGTLSVGDKIELINQLEYLGSANEDFVNPWSPEWCESH